MLYRVGMVTVYGLAKNPRISLAVYKVSDAVRIGRVCEYRGTVSIDPWPFPEPREWLLTNLEQATRP